MEITGVRDVDNIILKYKKYFEEKCFIDKIDRIFFYFEMEKNINFNRAIEVHNHNYHHLMNNIEKYVKEIDLEFLLILFVKCYDDYDMDFFIEKYKNILKNMKKKDIKKILISVEYFDVRDFIDIFEDDFKKIIDALDVIRETNYAFFYDCKTFTEYIIKSFGKKDIFKKYTDLLDEDLL